VHNLKVLNEQLSKAAAESAGRADELTRSSAGVEDNMAAALMRAEERADRCVVLAT
jgi:hypothetical protein